MVNPISAGVLEIWDDWKIKGSVLGSLGIQISLVLMSPLRKKTSLRAVIAMVWSCYLLADGVAVFGLGQIFNIKQETGSECNSGPPSSLSSTSKNNKFGDLAVLWCTFLLVHLCGPDTITAFSLPDTQLWLRQFIQMLVQAVSTFHLILLTLPCNKEL
ncbi:hypothetical protein DM860_016458 [Cuscuta australis]|uniref:DUF4220 domain-containing protein n=1 Tax=Cuscuta australis TaxID=267555 RepID=A0A328DE89_9ASTE|nr:hypothetical protein DM860_016458 [Cuscuta australis]